MATATAVMARRLDVERLAQQLLNASAVSWYLVMLLGQWVFAAYIASYFGTKLVRDGLAGLQQTGLFNGFIPGDTVGNSLVAAHVLFAAVIMSLGPLQLVPQIRARLPVFHHWVGRTYVLAAVTASLAGLYLIWSRPLFGALVNNIGTSIDGILVVTFATIAVRYAIARDIRTHRRWALRLFMAASAVWFIRIGFSLWNFLTGGIGIDKEGFSGPFVAVWHFGQFLLPLGILELYLRARDRGGAPARVAMAVGLVGVTVLMSIGLFLFATRRWLPNT